MFRYLVKADCLLQLLDKHDDIFSDAFVAVLESETELCFDGLMNVTLKLVGYEKKRMHWYSLKKKKISILRVLGKVNEQSVRYVGKCVVVKKTLMLP